MGRLLDTIRMLVADGHYVISEHASDRMIEREFLEWQVLAGTLDGVATRERPQNRPHPAVEIRGLLPDGTSFKAVWCLLGRSRVAKLVTVHYLDEE